MIDTSMEKISRIYKENSVIVIVTYNPGSNLKVALERYQALAKRVIIVDNGSTNFPELKGTEIDIVSSKVNKGIAWGLNEGIRKALPYTPEWIISFDQDSIPAWNIWDIYNDTLSQYHGSKPIGLMCGSFGLKSDTASLPTKWDESLILITSGMAHHVSVFDKVGLYNEEMFIDNVDFEYVMRTQLAGFATLHIQNDVIHHTIGTPLVRKFGPFLIESSNHDAFRRYYQGRNLIYLTRRFFFHFPLQLLNLNYYFFCKILPRILYVERPLRPKLKALLKGFKDGFKSLTPS